MRDQIFLVCLSGFIGLLFIVAVSLIVVVINKQKSQIDFILVNGYKIKFNDFYSVWQVSHDEIGSCAEFKTKNEAINYAKNG